MESTRFERNMAGLVQRTTISKCIQRATHTGKVLMGAAIGQNTVSGYRWGSASGMGVVVGGKIPLRGVSQLENKANWLDRDPEISITRDSSSHLHASTVPNIPKCRLGLYGLSVRGAVREVYMDDPGEAPVDSWMGWSAGRWEGGTLVVEVTGNTTARGLIARATTTAIR